MHNSADEAIIAAALAIEADNPAWLFTVAETWGSSPRPAGSLLLIDARGRQTGSVSGGCVEHDLIERIAAGELATGCPRLIRYGVSEDEARRFGLPCGGRLDLLVERVDDGGQWQVIQERLAQRALIERRTCLNTGEVSLHPVEGREGPDFVHEPGRLRRLFGPRWLLLLIGAGQIARELTPIAHALGYRVLICEPREDAAAQWDCPIADLVTDMPDDAATRYADDARSALVALTHDPKLDDMALMAALGSRAFYVGALGSRRSQERRRRRLVDDLGLPVEQVERLHGPVGLDIGGKTPAEIAVSIAAELTAVRHGRTR